MNSKIKRHLRMLSLGISGGILTFAFQNCSRFEASAMRRSVSKTFRSSPILPSSSFSSSSVVSCPAPDSGATPMQTADLLQGCIDRAAEGSTVELAPATYTVQRPILIAKSIFLKTKGLDASAPACLENANGACAVIKAVSPLSNLGYGFLTITAPTVRVEHIVVDGNRQARLNSPEAKSGASGNARPAFNVTITGGRDHVFYRMSSINALGGSALAFAGVTPGISLIENYVARAGVHNIYGGWADGITVTDSPDSVIRGNILRDNTDVDLIFGGCPRCDISGNLITHEDNFATSSFAAFMIYSWETSSGDYSGTVVQNNTVDCGAYRCGFGILLGQVPWNRGPLKGGLYQNNRVSGAQVGFAVNDVTDDAITLGSNSVVNSGGTFLTSSGVRELPAIYISPASRSRVKLQAGQLADWPTFDMTQSIPNWFTVEYRSPAAVAQAPVAQAPVVPVAQAPVAQTPVVPVSQAPVAQTPVVPVAQAPVVPVVQPPVTQAPVAINPGVRQIYLNLLGREPDSDGGVGFTNALNSGVSLEVIRLAIAGSAEVRTNIINDYNTYLPGCLNSARMNAWLEWFRHPAALRADFVQTLINVRAADPNILSTCNL